MTSGYDGFEQKLVPWSHVARLVGQERGDVPVDSWMLSCGILNMLSQRINQVALEQQMGLHDHARVGRGSDFGDFFLKQRAGHREKRDFGADIFLLAPKSSELVHFGRCRIVAAATADEQQQSIVGGHARQRLPQSHAGKLQ